MKNTGKLLIIFILVLFVTLTPVIVSANTNARTLKELRNELQQLKNKKAQQTADKNATKSKINVAKNDIGNKQNEIETNTKDIADATAESEQLTVEIAEGKVKLDKLVAAYQIAKENNAYLDYVFDSKSYDELVYRSALSEQLMDYLNEEITSWNDKIDKNEKLKVDLAEKSKQLESDINSLSSSIDQWGVYLNKLEEGAVSINEDIKSTEELIKYYTSIGCSETEDLEKCASVKGDTGFIRPLKKGVTTSYYGYRKLNSGSMGNFHSGVDIGGNSEGTPVYSVANGMVGKIIRQYSCGGNMVYVYHTIKGVQYTTTYMHLLTVNVSVGQAVTSQTQIGTVGGGKGTKSYERCSTGAHLHVSLATGWYGRTYTTSSQWKAHLVDPRKYISIPAKGVWFYSRY